ncbi:MAG: hypothetical protein WD800_01075, partial [Dehalococcoidia bacterium]
MEPYLDRLRDLWDRVRYWVTDAVEDTIDAFQGKRPRDRSGLDRTRKPRPPRAPRSPGESRQQRAADGPDREAPHEPNRGRERVPRRGIEGDSAVITATRDDDVASIVGRIDTADTPEVVLVVRRDARLLRRPTAWPHIAAHVRRRGIELGVVSTRGDVRSYARENGLRSARTPRGLRDAEYYLRVGERDVHIPPVPWGRIIRAGMIVTVLVAAFIVGCYEVPSAEVRLVPASDEYSVSMTVRPNAIVDESDVETGTIAASTIRRQLVTAVTTTTTGEAEVGDEHAVV